MNIYVLRRTDSGGYDTYSGFVIVAPTEEEAIKYSVDNYHEIPFSPWVTAECVICQLVGSASEEYNEIQVLLSDFKAG